MNSRGKKPLPVVKVCGITEKDDAVAIAHLGVWALGFIFVPESPRYVHPERVREIVACLGGSVLTVGVFQNAPLGEVQRIRDFCGLDLVQLHGDEDPAFCERLGKRVIKAFGVGEEVLPEGVEEYIPWVSYILLDTVYRGKRGGTGVQFPWQRVAPLVARLPRPVIIAGGLRVENVSHLLQVMCPFALDVNSGVEKAPGKKDVEKVKEFLAIVERKVVL